MKKRSKKPKVSLADTLVRAVCAEYAGDPSAPSVLVSYVAKAGGRAQPGFYASIVRYAEAYGQGKRVVCNTSGHPSALVALTHLSLAWLSEAAAKRKLVKLLDADDEFFYEKDGDR